MEEITTLGIDLAKRVFALHGVNARGRVVLRRVCRRDELMGIVAQLSPCLIGMEACSGAHEWARESERFGHTLRLMAPKFRAALSQGSGAAPVRRGRLERRVSLLGVGLGWLPSLVVAAIAAVLWPVIALILVFLVLLVMRA